MPSLLSKTMPPSHIPHDRYPPKKKQAIIEQAKHAILEGNASLQAIADHFAVPKRTLQFWLAQLGDEYRVLRQAWIDNILIEAGEEIEAVKTSAPVSKIGSEQLRLARARELWKRASWYAERRDAERYGVNREEQGMLTLKIPARFLESFRGAVVVTGKEPVPQPVVIEDHQEAIVMDSPEDNQ